MELTVRSSNNNEWGFVESYKKYSYFNTRTINAVVGVGKDGKMKEPFALRSGDFVPLSVIDGEMTVDRYLKAKKPIYCKLKDGFIVSMKAVIDLESGKFLPESSSFMIYTIDTRSSVFQGDSGVIKTVSMLEVPEEVKQLINSFMQVLAETDDRADFLRSRLSKEGIGVDEEVEDDEETEETDDLDERYVDEV